jgi:hypothetical protein
MFFDFLDQPVDLRIEKTRYAKRKNDDQARAPVVLGESE